MTLDVLSIAFKSQVKLRNATRYLSVWWCSFLEFTEVQGSFFLFEATPGKGWRVLQNAS